MIEAENAVINSWQLSVATLDEGSMDEEIVRSCIARRLSVSPDTIILSRIPTGKFNDSFYVTAGDREMVLRIAPGDDTFCLFYEKNMMKQEPGLHSDPKKLTEILSGEGLCNMMCRMYA